jgi:arylsulfatase A-like enzyme
MRIILSAFILFSLSVQAERPNIILIMVDDMGIEGLSSYGSADYSTPRLDQMAKEGMRFTQCYAQPLCTPSRVQIMTGRYNHRNYTNFGVLPPTEITFGHMMQTAGYKTAVAGKWQLFGHDTENYKAGGTGSLPQQAGFDESLLWQIKERKNLGERFADPLLVRNDEPAKSHKGKYGPDLFMEFIDEFITENKDDPFFLYFPMALVHNPFVPTPDSPEWESGDRYGKNNKHFKDMVEYMDKVVGQIQDKVIELGLADNTVLIFTSDNGTNRAITTKMQGGSIIKGNKGGTTLAGTHVPLIAWGPGIVQSGKTNQNLIDFSDFLPTIAELTGAKIPADRVIDGVSFAGQLKGKKTKIREWVYCDYAPRWGKWSPSRYVQDARWKLYGDGRFYDLENDPLEKIPIVVNDYSNLRSVVERFETLLARYED